MLSKEDYLTLDAIALGEGIARGDFSALEVNQCAVERAQEINPALNAIVHEGYDAALARVKAASPNNSSPLAGVPFLIKDLSPAAGLPACFGSALFKDFIAQDNAKIVQRYVDAGLNILGKTNTPEWGLTLTTEPVLTGACRNPWQLTHSTRVRRPWRLACRRWSRARPRKPPRRRAASEIAPRPAPSVASPGSTPNRPARCWPRQRGRKNGGRACCQARGPPLPGPS